MAQGDLVVFEESRAVILDGNFSSTDDIKCAVLDNTATPTVGAGPGALRFGSVQSVARAGGRLRRDSVVLPPQASSMSKAFRIGRIGLNTLADGEPAKWRPSR